MKSIRKNPVRNIDGNDKDSREFRRMKDKADARAYRAVKIATGALTIAIMAAVALAGSMDKKPEKPSAVLCEDKMEAKDGKMANDIPKCVKAKKSD